MNSNEAEKENNKTVTFEKLIESIMSEEVESEGIENLSRNVSSFDDAVKLIGRIEHIIKSKKNNILILAYHQGFILKRFKENIKFAGAVTNLKIGKATINFKIGIITFLDDYPKMRKSSVSLHFLKNNFKVTKEVCREHAIKLSINTLGNVNEFTLMFFLRCLSVFIVNFEQVNA